MIPHLLSTLALLGLALLLGATAYESVVMAPNFERDIPASIDLARQFLKRTTPAHYFRLGTPLTLLLLLASLVASWQIPPARWRLLTALGVLVLIDVMTFAFHYPRLAIMFKAPMPQDPTTLRHAAREWALGNLVRVILLAAAFLVTLQAVTMLARPAGQATPWAKHSVNAPLLTHHHSRPGTTGYLGNGPTYSRHDWRPR